MNSQSAMKDSQSDVKKYASEHPETTKLLDSGKLQFTQTGMEFPSTATNATLVAYATGRAYRRALWARENEAYDFTQHEPWIVGHKHRDEKHFLYCTLTNKTLPRRKDCVEGHVNGKKFKRRQKEVVEAKERKKEQEQRRREKIKRGKQRQREEQKEEEDKKDTEQEMGENEQGGEDVLAGILDSDQEMEENESGSGDEDDQTVQKRNVIRMKQDKARKQDATEDEGNVFWTRGRGSKKSSEYDSDDDKMNDNEEWDKSVGEFPKVHKSLKVQTTESAEDPGMDVEIENGAAMMAGSKDDPEPLKKASKKRRRDFKLSKKTMKRSQNQRRKTLAEET